MASPFLSEIRLASFDFPPKGWAQCDGQLLPINQNQALFSLLGTTYGGDGRVNFALPDLRGRTPFHMGGGLTLGERGGEEAHTLITSEIPAHTHPANSAAISVGNAIGNYWGDGTAVGVNLYASSPVDSPMAAGLIGNNSGGQPHNNLSPYLVLNYIIALQGIFPSQS